MFDVSPPLLDRLLGGKPRSYLKAVDDVSFEIARGQTFALVGESGCGKSTVARLAVKLYRPTRGTIEFDGTDIAGLNTRAYDVGPDDERFVMVRNRSDPEGMGQIVVVENFFEELKAKVGN